jgi:hypothetical protein
MLSRRISAVGAVFLALAVLAGAAAPKSDKSPTRKPSKEDVNDLSMEVAALQTIHQLKLDKAQIDALGKLAREITPDGQEREAAKVSDKYRKALLALRDAFTADDDDRIDGRAKALDELRSKETPEVDDGIEIVAAARTKAVEYVAHLKSRQIASYLAGVGDDDLDGPAERLSAAFEESRKKSGEEWDEARDAAAEAVGWLVAGLDADASAKVTDQAKTLLERAHLLSDADFKAQRKELDSAARKLVGDLSSMDVLRRVVEHGLAELLSNPRLGAAVEARLKTMK